MTDQDRQWLLRVAEALSQSEPDPQGNVQLPSELARQIAMRLAAIAKEDSNAK